MAETIAILFVFFVLLAIGMVFFFNIKKVSIEQESEVLYNKKAVEIALKANYLPELGCRFDNIVRDNCLDTLRIKYAQEVMEDTDYYFDIFGFSKISVFQIYPEFEDLGNVYNKEQSGSKFLTRLPTLLYDPIQDEYTLGVINVETFY